MSRLQKAKHEEELRKKQAAMRGNQPDDDEDEFYEGGYGRPQGQKASKAETASEPQVDLLACTKCKQFGHLSYQCMNMFAQDGAKTATPSNRTMLTAESDN